MIKFFRGLEYKIKLLIIKAEFISDQLSDIYDTLSKNKKEEAPLLTVARHTLGSIDISDIENPDDQSPETYLEYTARAAQFYNFFEKEAEWMMKLQHDYWFRNADGEGQMYFGRGTTNGIQLMIDRFKLLRDSHLQGIKKEEEVPLGSREDILAKLQVGSNEPDDSVKE